ncbi:MAG TPA: large conductance mechanosensitive channel protein MscL [Patescibacteria group bacterium]|nr:large conductance mechanosensitive channel protein MscL [Patescibacteria group bacterium]
MAKLEGFKKFILRGNAIDLAVGVVIGAAFTDVVNSIVKGFLTPLIGVIAKPDFSGWKIALRGNEFLIGGIINSLIGFVLVAAAVYFFVVTPMNKLMTRLKKDDSAAAVIKECSECLSKIPAGAARCAFCTIKLN